MTDTERVELLKRMGFGGMDETLISKLRRPEYYGSNSRQTQVAAWGSY